MAKGKVIRDYMISEAPNISDMWDSVRTKHSSKWRRPLDMNLEIVRDGERTGYSIIPPVFIDGILADEFAKDCYWIWGEIEFLKSEESLSEGLQGYRQKFKGFWNVRRQMGWIDRVERYSMFD